MDFDRYQRHIILPEIGESGQRKLNEAKILVVGLGGLGCPASMYRAGAGIGFLGIADFDLVDKSNLHRQILYTDKDIGESKAKLASKKLKEYNPELKTQIIERRIDSTFEFQELEDFDCIIDCSDNFETRYTLNRYCHHKQIALIYGAIHKFEGQISVFDSKRGPCYNCLYPESKSEQVLIPNCAEVGVLGALPGIIGTMQALEAIKLTLQLEETLVGKLLIYNALTHETRKIKLPKVKNCLVCSQLPQTTKIESVKTVVCNSESEIINLTVKQLKDLLSEGTNDYIILDVRKPEEHLVSRIPGSEPAPLDELEERIKDLSPKKKYILYCRSGSRSLLACHKLLNHGFKSVHNLVGGITAWNIQMK